MKPLDGKIALVTGSSQGIGRAIVERLSAEGAQVVINYSGKPEHANEVVAGIGERGGKAFAIQADLGNVAEIERLFQEIRAQAGKLDILVNNAGVGAMHMLSEITEAEFDRVFNLNAKGTLFCLKQASLHLADNGRIVNIASSTVDFPSEGTAIYAGSKATIKLYTKVAALELGKRGITVNTVSPGMIATALNEKMPDTVKQMVAASSPFNRLGNTDDIASVVAFLVSDAAQWITGQDILVNGGATH